MHKSLKTCFQVQIQGYAFTHTCTQTSFCPSNISMLWSMVEGQIRGVRNVNRHIKIQQRRVGCSQKEVVGDTATSVHSHSWHYLRRPHTQRGDLAHENQCCCLERDPANYKKTGHWGKPSWTTLHYSKGLKASASPQHSPQMAVFPIWPPCLPFVVSVNTTTMSKVELICCVASGNETQFNLMQPSLSKNTGNTGLSVLSLLITLKSMITLQQLGSQEESCGENRIS